MSLRHGLAPSTSREICDQVVLEGARNQRPCRRLAKALSANSAKARGRRSLGSRSPLLQPTDRVSGQPASAQSCCRDVEDRRKEGASQRRAILWGGVPASRTGMAAGLQGARIRQPRQRGSSADSGERGSLRVWGRVLVERHTNSSIESHAGTLLVEHHDTQESGHIPTNVIPIQPLNPAASECKRLGNQSIFKVDDLP